MEIVVESPGVASQRTLSDRHKAELHASGLTDATIEAAGIYTAESSEVGKILGWTSRDFRWGTGLVIPYDGDYARVKLDVPRYGEGDRLIKYEAPVKSPTRAYFPPGFATPKRGETLVVTEGEKKTLAIWQTGLACVGLPGVWSWQRKRERTDTGRAYGKRRLIADLSSLDWKGIRVVICFDSDAADNDLVRMAEVRLAEVLSGLGAEVAIARIPPGSDAKVGADDYIVKHGSDAFLQIIGSAKEPEKIPPPSPFDMARMYLGELHTRQDDVTIRWHRDSWLAYTGTCYREVPEAEVKASILSYLDDRHLKATPAVTSDVAACLMAEVRIPHDVTLPTLHTDRGWQHPELIAFHNGIADLDELVSGECKLRKHTPRWVSTFALPYKYEPDAECPTWFATLDSIFNGDEQSVDALGELFGLCLTDDTRLHKIGLLTGSRRGGKGTVLRTLRATIGDDNCCSPCLSQLAERFGLQGLLNKRVATVNDAHLGHGDRALAVLERLKSISGEDSIDIDRKHREPLLNVRLKVRFVLACNELPKFGDTANALVPRLLILPFPNSFEGREDRNLESKLLTERSGILNWSLDGLRRLRTNGTFTVPEASKAMLADFARLTSPVQAFLEDACIVGAGGEVTRDDLWRAWCGFCEVNGNHTGSRERFGSQLKTLVPSLDQVRPRDGGIRHRRYVGISLSDDGWDLTKIVTDKHKDKDE